MSAPTVANTTIEYFDGFDDYNTAQMSRYWTNVLGGGSIGIAAVGRNSSNGMQVTSMGGSIGVGITLTPQTTRTMGVAFKFTGFYGGGFGSAVPTLLSFVDGASIQCDLRLNGDGTVCVTRNGTVLGTSTAALSINTWYYLEFSLTINASTGSYTVKLNGTTILTATGANTKNTANSTANVVAIGNYLVNNQGLNASYYDDFYCRADGTFCGDCQVETKLPTGNGATTNFVPLAGTNWGSAADNPADDDTSYNASSTVGDIDLYTYPALTASAGAVQAVMTCPVMKNDSAGLVTAVSQYRQSSTNYSGGSQSVGSTTYTAYPDIQGQDPSTSAAWTIAGVNSAQFGVKRTA